jgi:hypothetical protein
VSGVILAYFLLRELGHDKFAGRPFAVAVLELGVCE